jgi:O-methyltransferase
MAQMIERDGAVDTVASTLSPAARLYLDLLKRCLTREVLGQLYRPLAPYSPMPARLTGWTNTALSALLRKPVVVMVKTSPDARAMGKDWPADAETMIGRKRLDNLESLVVDVIDRGVPGDLLEAGVWRGGAAILMRAVLRACGDTQRLVWAADSFQGLPRPNATRFPADRSYQSLHIDIAVPLEEVKTNFARYGLLDDQVRFLVGWFSDTLPAAPVDRLAVLRLDGDMYQSTIEALDALYPKVSTGGYVIIDDYFLPSCRQAVDDYRARHRVVETLEPIDWASVYWRKR